ncbi:hypothetical protein KUTeg_019969 [Tegillarca granosa]|uniref:ZP domain-containing protein n=1 Tax=Tegillarca granosa TaxID=220873 RepID=A0ABQ9EE46_TEGGR|nr:hypothetical protein KUTeg_019969 [Tegillarca granosa]
MKQTIPLQERHDIVCGTSGISAVVPHSLFPGNPTVTWSDPSCSVQSNGSHFVASIGFHDCGTTVRFTTDTVIFENTLKSNGATTMNPVVDFGESSVYTIPIQCVYQRKENVTGSFFPIRQTTRYFEKRFGHLDLHMEKYTDDKFTRTLTNQRIPLGSDFFVKLTVDHLNRSDLAIKADNCVATPTSSPADSLFFRLLQDGCPSSSAVHLIQSAYNEVRFRMTSFIFRGTGTGLVYIHCEVSVCPASSTECSVGCSNRRKRAASNVHSSHLLSAGPILLVTDEGTPASVIVAAVCAAVAVVATVFAVIGWRRRRDFGKTDILH